MHGIETPLPRKFMRVFQRSVKAYFTPVAISFGSRLKRLSPSLYGFLTDYAVVTIGIYHGHFPGVCVKVRQREPGEPLAVADGRDIGLANIVAFSDSTAPPRPNPVAPWTEASLETEVRTLADELVRYGRPFVMEAKADWNRLRGYVHQQIKKAFEDAPWLREYQQV
jgi:hypothetical protein